MEKILKDNETNMSKTISAAESHIVRQISWTVCPMLEGHREDIFLDQL